MTVNNQQKNKVPENLAERFFNALP